MDSFCLLKSGWLDNYFSQHRGLSIGNLVWIAFNCLRLLQKGGRITHLGPFQHLYCTTNPDDIDRRRSIAYISGIFGQLAYLRRANSSKKWVVVKKEVVVMEERVEEGVVMEERVEEEMASSLFFTIREAGLPDVSLTRLIPLLNHVDWTVEGAPQPLSQSDLVLHLRGGDILPGGVFAHLGFYVQPPLRFYLQAAQQHMARFPHGSIFVLCDDTHPYIPELKRVHSNIIVHSKRNAVDDWATLMTAHHVVLSRGSFALLAALLARYVFQTLETVYVFTEIQDKVERFDDWSALDVRDWVAQPFPNSLHNSNIPNRSI